MVINILLHGGADSIETSAKGRRLQAWLWEILRGSK